MKFGTCRCGAWWQQWSNATGHCGNCHRTFSSLAAFDTHQIGPHTQCVDPASLARQSGEPLFVRQEGGAQSSQGYVWALRPTQAQRESLQRLRGR